MRATTEKYNAYKAAVTDPVSFGDWCQIANSYERWTIIEEGGQYLVFGFDVMEEPESFEDRADAVIHCAEMNETRP